MKKGCQGICSIYYRSMPYRVRCIIPHDRYCRFDGLTLVPEEINAAEADEEDRRLTETKLILVGQDGERRESSLLELSNLLGFAYATHLAWMDEKDLRLMPVTWGLPQYSSLDTGEEVVSPTAADLGISQQLENGEIHTQIEIRYIDPAMGWGVFASSPLPTGEFIGEYVGIVLQTQNPGPYSLNFPCLDGGHEINASDTGNLMRFINHSSQPNASFQRVFHEHIVHTVVRLVRPVSAGGQICVDYSPSYWIGRGVVPQPNL